jgi:predicted site-specific integrase-resolvase
VTAKDQPPGRVFGYARVSSVSQEDNTSLAVQAERIRSFTAARGWPDPQVIEDIASGANLVRPGLASLRDTRTPSAARPGVKEGRSNGSLRLRARDPSLSDRARARRTG